MMQEEILRHQKKIFAKDFNMPKIKSMGRGIRTLANLYLANVSNIFRDYVQLNKYDHVHRGKIRNPYALTHKFLKKKKKKKKKYPRLTDQIMQ